MSRRGVFSAVNVAVLGASLAGMLLYPQYAGYTLYAIVAWLAAVLALTWSGWASGPSSSAAPTSPPPAPGLSSAAPRPGPSSEPIPPIDFCIFCGTKFSPGDRTCGACGHALPRLVPVG